jgi:hypothetical protein
MKHGLPIVGRLPVCLKAARQSAWFGNMLTIQGAAEAASTQNDALIFDVRRANCHHIPRREMNHARQSTVNVMTALLAMAVLLPVAGSSVASAGRHGRLSIGDMRQIVRARFSYRPLATQTSTRRLTFSDSPMPCLERPAVYYITLVNASHFRGRTVRVRPQAAKSITSNSSSMGCIRAASRGIPSWRAITSGHSTARRTPTSPIAIPYRWHPKISLSTVGSSKATRT